MLLGITEFTKAYLQVKDDPWPFVDLVKLTRNSRMKDGEVVDCLKSRTDIFPGLNWNMIDSMRKKFIER